MNVIGNKFAELQRMRAQTVLVLGASFKSFQSDRGLLRAASLAFYSFMALPPLLLLLSILLSQLFVFQSGIEESLRRFLHQALPFAADTILVEIEKLAQQRGWGLASMLVLFWSVTPLAAAVRHSMTDIFRTRHKRSFFFSKGADALAVMLLLLTLLALLFLTVIESFKHVFFSLQGGMIPMMGLLAQYALPLLVSTVLLSLVFMITSPLRLGWRELLLGGLVTSVLLLSVGPAMSMFLRVNPRYGYTFGSLKTVFLLIIWVYYAFAAILFGGEVMANTHRRDTLLLSRLFRRGRTGRVAEPLLRRFVRTVPPAGILFAQGDNGQEMFYLLSGTVEMVIDGKPVKTFNPGEYFGEMALLLGAPRTATARAGADGAELASVSPATLNEVLRENTDIMLDLLRELARRLQSTNRLIAGRDTSA